MELKELQGSTAQMKTVKIKAMSNWYREERDAERDCERIIRQKENSALRDAERDGWEYRGGSTSGFDVDYDQRRNMYRYSAERILNFRLDKNLKFLEAEEISYEKYLELTETELEDKLDLSAPVPLDVTGQLRTLIKPLVPSILERRVWIRIGPIKTPKIVKLPLNSIVFNNLKIVSSDLKLEDSVPVGLPINDTVYRWEYNNCGELEQQFDQDFSYQHRTGFTLEFSKTVSSEVSVGGELSFSGSSWGGTASFSKRITTTIENRRTYSEEKTETRSGNYTFRVAQNTKTKIILTIQQFEARRGFKGPVVIEGSFYLVYGKDVIVDHKLTDFLNEQQRTLSIEGYYANLDCRIIPIDIFTEPCH